MKYPNFNEEKKLWSQGYEFVVGLDEAGRGPLAGPVVASAIFLQKNCRIKLKIKDSKKLSAKQRDFFYEKLTNHSDIRWEVGIVSEKIIDKINILEATKLAMEKAAYNLRQKVRARELFDGGGFFILDGNFKINSKIPQKSIIKGDQKVFSVAAASIIAKVTRDRIMQKMHKKYPQYGFGQHKGYGTKLHIENMRNFGLCKIHRKSFYPVSRLHNVRYILDSVRPQPHGVLPQNSL